MRNIKFPAGDLERRMVMSMNVNGVTGADTYSAYNTTKATEKAAEATQNKKAESGVVYEKNTAAAKKTYKPDTNMVAKLKADAEERTARFKSLVEQLMTKQSTTYGQATDIWSFLSKGDFTVDPATKAQAQQDISEDGYWGVNKTSDRIVQFATALTGGDPDKIEEMRDAFIKGYKQAEKTWGGKLPDISQQTYDAVMKKFDDMAAAAKTADTN